MMMYDSVVIKKKSELDANLITAQLEQFLNYPGRDAGNYKTAS